jgi:hypothetical protein
MTVEIVTNERVVSGVFFRNPIFGRYYGIYDNWYGDNINTDGNLYCVEKRIGFLGWMNWLLNSKKKIKDTQEFVTSENAAGYVFRSVRSPIYFKRVERTAEYFSDDMTIKSWGFNYIDERVYGGCVKERTIIRKKINGKMKTIFNKLTHVNNGYKMTYKSVIEDFLKTGRI